MTGRGFTHEVAARAAATRFEDLPDDVVELARQCLLDWFGVTLAGSAEECAQLLVDDLIDGRGGSGGGASVIGRECRLSMLEAATVNGTASHALDFDDVNQAMIGHPSVPVLAGLLALAEHVGADGRGLVAAFVAGYEAECQVGRAVGVDHYQIGFHATATVGTFGAAAACARLLGLDADRTATALGIAATEAAGLKSMFGTMCKPFHAGRASAAGLGAARLAARGFTAAAAAIETEQGFAETHAAGFDPARGLREAPRGWWLRENLFKYHAACFQTHSSIEGLRRLRDAERLTVEQVRGVTIHADPMQMRMCAIPEPTTGLEAKFSLRHTAAMVLAGRDTSAPASFDDDDAFDDVVLSLRERVTVTADRDPGGPTPVDLIVAGGRTLTASHDVSVPEADLGLQGRQLRAKFDALASPVLGGERATRLARAIEALPDDGSTASLMLSLARQSSP